MKLNSSGAKDEAHLEILDTCGLISPLIEVGLPEALRERPEQARKRYSSREFSEGE